MRAKSCIFALVALESARRDRKHELGRQATRSRRCRVAVVGRTRKSEAIDGFEHSVACQRVRVGCNSWRLEREDRFLIFALELRRILVGRVYERGKRSYRIRYTIFDDEEINSPRKSPLDEFSEFYCNANRDSEDLLGYDRMQAGPGFLHRRHG